MTFFVAWREKCCGLSHEKSPRGRRTRSETGRPARKRDRRLIDEDSFAIRQFHDKRHKRLAMLEFAQRTSELLFAHIANLTRANGSCNRFSCAADSAFHSLGAGNSVK